MSLTLVGNFLGHAVLRTLSFIGNSCRPTRLRSPTVFLWATVAAPCMVLGSSVTRLFSSQVECNSPEDIARYLKAGRFKKIVVMAGAGISTPSGIPDFRTPGTGLYDNLEKYNLPYPEAVFDLDYFRRDPSAFFIVANELYSRKHRPNIAHYLVRFLHEEGLLLRMYTQNIDGLERLAGLAEEKLIESHGTFATATCQACRKAYKGADIEESIFKGEIPKCNQSLCNGVIKPDVVFFGEQLPGRFWKFLEDLPQADLLIVMGTSLEVHPFAGVAEAVLPGIPRILFNKQATGPFLDSPRKNDVVAKGDLVEKIEEFCSMVGWYDELREFMESEEARVNEE